jgi:sec-independent protein translocase protein TatA
MPGIPEMLVIGGVIVLLFGATKLPRLGKGLGEGIRNFKTGLMGSKEENKKKESTEEENALTKTDDPEKGE